MSENLFEPIVAQYSNILKSKFSKIFIDLFSKFVDDPNYCIEAFSTPREKNVFTKGNKLIVFNPWYEIYVQICKHQRAQNLPSMAFNYCYEKAKQLYKKMKKISKRHNIKFMYIAKIIYKEFMAIQQSNRKNYLKTENSPKEEKISLKNYLKQRTVASIALSHTNSFMSTNPQNRLNNKFLNETEEEKKEEKEKQKSNYINKINKLNIFVGEYDSLLLDQVVEKTKIYDGNLCTTYVLKKDDEKKYVGGKEKVKRLLSNGKAIFIANDSNNENNSVKAAPFMKYSMRTKISGKFPPSATKDNLKNKFSSTVNSFKSVSIKSKTNQIELSASNMPHLSVKNSNPVKKTNVSFFRLNSKSNSNKKAKQDNEKNLFKNKLYPTYPRLSEESTEKKLQTEIKEIMLNNSSKGTRYVIDSNKTHNMVNNFRHIKNSQSVVNSNLGIKKEISYGKEFDEHVLTINRNKSPPIIAKLLLKND